MGSSLGASPFSPAVFLLSSVCEEIITTFLPAHKEPEEVITSSAPYSALQYSPRQLGICHFFVEVQKYATLISFQFFLRTQ